MCALILMFFFGFFAFFGISTTTSTMSMVEPPVAVVESAQAESTQAEAVPIPTDAVLLSCEPLKAQEDEAMVESYHADVLTTDEGWEFTLSDAELKTIGTWMNNDLGAVAYMELLHYDCGLPPNVVEGYFNSDTFPILFSNYDSYRLLTTCNKDDQWLYVFEASDEGRDYEVRYWFEPMEARRLAMFMLTTPVSQSATIQPMLADLYPDLPNCRSAGAG